MSDMKCPFCQTELEQKHEKILGCPNCLYIADGAFWGKVIQVKQDFETLEQACEKIKSEYNRCRRDEFEGWDIDWDWFVCAAKNVIDTALTKIEHKGV